MAVITVINLFGQKVVKYVMNLATIGKLAALVLIIVAGVVLLIVSGASSNLSQVDQITQNGQKIVPTLTTTGFVMAIVSAFYAFTGFESVASGSDDMKNPAKKLTTRYSFSYYCYRGNLYWGCCCCNDARSKSINDN